MGAKTGVVAPVPINTPSLRQETHGSQGDNAAMSSINRSSAGGWGSAAGVSSVSAGSATDQSVVSGKARGRVDGGSRAQGGDDVFTRHFPDLRAGLEQAEKLDAVSKASSKVAPLRKPKPEPSRGQGPSLRPRGTYAGLLQFLFSEFHLRLVVRLQQQWTNINSPAGLQYTSKKTNCTLRNTCNTAIDHPPETPHPPRHPASL